MLMTYLRLTKPGVMLGNLVTTVAGFLFAAGGHIDWKLFLATSIGSGLIIASACVINNVLDQDIDAKMDRTKSRPLITGEATGRIATIFGIILGLTGVSILIAWTNWWVVGVGLFGFITYVWLYGALGKRKSVHGTLVGSLSGAAPILAGYVAVNPGLDSAAITLFLILFFWQMPEFYSIAIYRLKEYKAAHVPVITVMRGVNHAKKQILAYTFAFAVSSLALFGLGYTSFVYFVVMGILNARWLQLGIQGLSATDDSAWAKGMFRFSLIILLVFCCMLSVDSLLP